MQTLTYGHVPPAWPGTLMGQWEPRAGWLCHGKAGFGPMEPSKCLELAPAAAAGEAQPHRVRRNGSVPPLSS